AFGRGVAGELGRPLALGDIEPQFALGSRARALPRGARGSLLLRHRRVEPGTVYPDTTDAQRVLGQVIGEAEGVIESESGLAGQSAALTHPRCRFVEQPQAVGECAAEL